MHGKVFPFDESWAPKNQRVLIYGSMPDGTEEVGMGWKDRSDGRWYFSPQGGLVPFKVEQWFTVPEKQTLNSIDARDIEIIGEPMKIERTPLFWRWLGWKPYRQFAMLRMPQGDIVGVFVYRDTPE